MGGGRGTGHGGGGGDAGKGYHNAASKADNTAAEEFKIENIKGKTLDMVMEEFKVLKERRMESRFWEWHGTLRVPTVGEFMNFFDLLQCPDGFQRRSWDLLIVVLVLIVCVLVPLKICVPFWHPNKSYYVFSYTMDALFWADMFVNFNANFYDRDHLVTDKYHIALHYVYGNPFTHNTGWFWIDLFANIPWELVAANNDESKHRKAFKIAKLLKLPRLLRIGKLMKYLGHYVNFAMFIKHSFASILFLHCMSCWYIGLYYKHITCEHYASHGDDHAYDDHGDDHGDDDHGRRFLSGGDDPSGGTCVKLSIAYVEAVTSIISMIVGGTPTVAGVNYNQVHITGGVGDYWLQLCTKIIGTGLYWTMQADTVVILLNSSNAYTSHRVRIDRASQELAYFGVPHDLKIKVKSAMEYQWRAMMPSRCTVFKDESLSPHLRQEIVMHFHGRELRNTALFAGCSNGCVAAAALKLNSIVVRSFDFIIRQGEVGRELFLLSRGRAAVSSNEIIVALVEEGNFFGETALVSKTSPYRTVDVVALVWCELQMLSREHFRELCHDYPAVLANAEMMMTMLEQEPNMCDVLWSYYLRKKNDILMESIAAALGTDEGTGLERGAEAPASPTAAKQSMLVDGNHKPGAVLPERGVAPRKPHAAGHGGSSTPRSDDGGFKQTQLQAVDAATYKHKTQELYEAVKNGTLRGHALKEMVSSTGASGKPAAPPLAPTPEAAAGEIPAARASKESVLRTSTRRANTMQNQIVNSMDHAPPVGGAPPTGDNLTVLGAVADPGGNMREVEELLSEVEDEEGKDAADTQARVQKIRSSFRHSGCL